jgi:hypothetical protein
MLTELVGQDLKIKYKEAVTEKTSPNFRAVCRNTFADLPCVMRNSNTAIERYAKCDQKLRLNSYLRQTAVYK